MGCYVWQDRDGSFPLWRGDSFDGPVLPVMTKASSRANRLCQQGSARGSWVPAAPVLELAERNGVRVVLDLHRVGRRARLGQLDAAVEFEECFGWSVDVNCDD